MRHSIIHAFFFLSMLCGSAFAHEATPAERAPAHFVYEEIGLYDSVEGESKTAFMTRVAQGLLEFTNRRGFEGCGVVQVNQDGAWRVRLTTTGSQLACARVAFREPGYVATSEFIHSHPPISRITVNAIDARLIRRVEGDKVGVVPADYSEGDKRNGGGWLVVPKWRFEAAQLRFLESGSSGNGWRVTKLNPVSATVPETIGAEPYVMSANGSQSSTMQVSIRDHH